MHSSLLCERERVFLGTGLGNGCLRWGRGRGGSDETNWAPLWSDDLHSNFSRLFHPPSVILLCTDLQTLLPGCRFCCALHGYKCTRKWREKKKSGRRTDGRNAPWLTELYGCTWMVAFGFLMHSSYWATFIMQIKWLESSRLWSEVFPKWVFPLPPPSPQKLHLPWALILGWSRVGAYFTNAPTFKAINGVKHQ